MGEASVLGPMEYIRLVYAALIGFFMFSEVPDAATWVGAAIIVAATLYIARHETRASGGPG
jgi:drug/metabolite transporter (DMT)-like permease